MVDLPITTALIGGEQAVAGLNREAAAVDKTTKATQKKTQAQRESEKAIKAETRARLMAERQSAREAQRASRLAERGRLRDQTAMERLQDRDYRRQAREQSAQKRGTVFQRVAGAAGAGAGRVAGAVGLGGGLGAAVIGVAGLMSGLKIMTTLSERSARAVDAEINARNAHTDALKNARNAVRGQALGYAQGGAKTEAALDALGVKRGQIKGAGGEDALLALAQKGMASERNIALVNEASATFLVTAEQAAGKIIDGARTASEILTKQLDVRYDQAGIAAATARAGRSAAAGAVIDADNAAIKVVEAERRSALTGTGLKNATSQMVTDARDPALAEQRKLVAANNRALMDLNDKLERMNIFDVALDLFKSTYGSGGVREQYRLETIKADVLNAMPVTRSHGATQ